MPVFNKWLKRSSSKVWAKTLHNNRFAPLADDDNKDDDDNEAKNIKQNDMAAYSNSSTNLLPYAMIPIPAPTPSQTKS